MLAHISRVGPCTTCWPVRLFLSSRYTPPAFDSHVLDDDRVWVVPRFRCGSVTELLTTASRATGAAAAVSLLLRHCACAFRVDRAMLLVVRVFACDSGPGLSGITGQCQSRTTTRCLRRLMAAVADRSVVHVCRRVSLPGWQEDRGQVPAGHRPPARRRGVPAGMRRLPKRSDLLSCARGVLTWSRGRTRVVSQQGGQRLRPHSTFRVFFSCFSVRVHSCVVRVSCIVSLVSCQCCVSVSLCLVCMCRRECCCRCAVVAVCVPCRSTCPRGCVASCRPMHAVTLPCLTTP